MAVQDANSNTVSTATTSVTIAIGSNPASGTLTGTTTVAAVNGVATFSNLSIDKAGTGYTLTAAAGGLTGATSSAFNVVAGAAAKLAFTVQPTNATATVALSPAVQVTVQDAQGNTVTSATTSITLAIGTNAGGGTLSGTATVAAVSGVATFSNVSIDKSGTGYTLTAAATGLTGASGSTFNVTAGAASKLAFAVQPTNATAGAAISPAVQVTVQDAQGNTATSATTSITLAIGTNAGGGTLSGTATVAAVNGVASSSNLSIDKAGTGYTLTASASGLTAATSGAFNVTAGAAGKLTFSVQPSNVTAGASISPAVQVTVQDAQGNTVTSASTSITLAIGTNPGGGTLSGTATVAAVSGVASFSTLSIDKAGTGYTLTAAATGLTGATSATFNVTAGFTNATLQGAYSLSEFIFFGIGSQQSNTPPTGSPLPVPKGFESGLGILTFDGAGSFAFSGTSNRDGVASQVSDNGTYSVAPDGTVTIGTALIGSVLAGGSVVIFASTSGKPEIGVAIKKGGTFTNTSLSGTYSFSDFHFGLQTAQPNTPAQGSPLPVPKGFSSSFGSVTFDGAGNATASGTLSRDGTTAAFTDNFAYSVATDGTFTLGGNLTGSLLAGGSVFVLAATSGDPDVGVGIKKGGTFNNASLSGTYSISDFYFNGVGQSNTPAQGTPLPVPKGFHSAFETVTFDGAGNATLSGTENTDGTAASVTMSFTYSVATDGTVTLPPSGNDAETGSVLAGGSVFILAKTSGAPGITVGIKR